MNKPVLSQKEIDCLRSLANNNLCVSAAAKEAHYHRNTVVYHLTRVQEKTGLDPFRFFDLAQLLGITENPQHVSPDERRAIYLAAFEKYGEQCQQNKFDEELGEFLTELGRMRNGAGNYANLAEEMADLTIMLEQLAMIYGIEDEMAEQKDYKVRRLAQRIEGKGDNI